MNQPSRCTPAEAKSIAAAFNGPPRNHSEGRHGTRPTTAPATLAMLRS